MKTLSKPKAAVSKSVQRTTKKTAPKEDANGTTNGHAHVTAESALQTEEIARRAYTIWQENGCQEGCEEEHWHQAERELSNRVPS